MQIKLYYLFFYYTGWGVSTGPTGNLNNTGGWLPSRENNTICPQGLQWLMPLDRIFIDREPEGLEGKKLCKLNFN